MTSVASVDTSDAADKQKKPHACTHEGCGKSFSRAEHLRRHALNHEPSDTCCDRCNVHFNRPDLLARHMARHVKRDEEAGGPGLGVLETRKRARRAPDGTIVEKPSKRMLRAGITTTVKSITPSEGHSSPGAMNGAPPLQAPVSPPHSFGSSESYNSGGLENTNVLPIGSQADQFGSYGVAINQDANMASLERQWTSDAPMDGKNDLFDDIFNPDTASSFNQPFTTMNNYNWLFEAPSMKDAFYNDDFTTMPVIDPLVQAPIDQFWAPPTNAIPVATTNFFENSRYQNNNQIPQLPSPSDERSSIKSFSTVPINGGDPALQSVHQLSDSSPQPPSQPRTSASPQRPIEDVDMVQMHTEPVVSPETADNDWMGIESSPSIHCRLPVITEGVRSSILDVIGEIFPITLQGNKIEADSPLLTLSALQDYSNLFFTRFNTAYPLLHQATFDPSQTEPLLVISVLLLGATYSSRGAHQMAVGIHDTLRPRIFSHPAFAATPDLWVLQTILLVECFGKSRAGLKQHDMSHLFHGMLINLIRRSDCQNINTRPVQSIPAEASLDREWRTAMEAESKKRLALLCFLWDVQHAQLFGQSLCMSAFELRSSLPCDSATWEASTPEEWLRQSRQEQTHHSFLKVLKGYMTPATAPRPRHLNVLSRILLLHGLMSISWDLRRRDQTSLGADGDAAGSWKARIGRAYDLWLTDFDADCLNMKLNLMHDKRKFTGLKTSTHAIYHAAHIVLNVEVIDLQIAAGAPHILGRKVSPGDYDRSRRVIEKLMNEDVRGATKAAWHASRIISDSVMNLNDWDDNDVFHYPWCLYLATLVCWGFHLPSSVNGHHVMGRRRTDDAKGDMTALVVGMTSCKSVDDLSTLAGKYDTSGLTTIMGKQLATVRWAIVHDAMKVLNRLSVSGES